MQIVYNGSEFKMARYMSFCLWLGISSLFPYHVAKRPEPTCLFPEDQTSREYACTKVRCKKPGSVIANFEPVSGCIHGMDITALRTTDPVCMGETADFIDESLNCFWKSYCTVRFPQGSMITSRGGQLETFTKGFKPRHDFNYQCYSKAPDFTCIINAKCVKESEIFDIISLSQSCSSEAIKRKKKGIIRSHDHYPWNYVYNPKTNTILVGFQLTKQIGKSKTVQVGVYDLDIQDDDDITITTAMRTIKLNTSGIVEDGELVGDLTNVLRFTRNDKYIQFTFHVSHESMEGFRGFLICFKESKKGGRKHPCKKVVKIPAQVTTIQPYSNDCLTNVNGKKAKEKCCCNVNDHDSCNKAIQEAAYMWNSTLG